MKKCRNILALVLSLCLMLTLTPLTALADPAVIDSGNFAKYGDAYASVTWCMTDDGTLTIGGTGAMPNFGYPGYQQSPYYQYKDQVTALVIENGVTGLGSYAFRDFSSIAGILNIPDSITSFGSETFSFCSGLTGVNCSSLDVWINISFPFVFSNPLYYAHTLYINGEPLTSLSWPADRTVIPPYVFCGCTSLTSLSMPDTVTAIGEGAFEECTAISGELVLSSQLQTIGNLAFLRCRGLSGAITIPDTLTVIGSSAFGECTGFTRVNCSSLDVWSSITFGSTDANPLNFAKYLYINGEPLTQFSWPEDKTVIQNYAFINCQTLTGNLDIPDRITSIGDYAFWCCSELNGTLKLGSGLKSIGKYAFDSCQNLTGALTIPDSVQTIGRNAFSNCSGFNGALTLSNQLQTIADCVFQSCSGLIGPLNLPSTLKLVGNYAFSGCTSLDGNILFPDSVTNIGMDSFNGCRSIESVSFGQNLLNIGNCSFSGCYALSGDLVIPDSVETIGLGAFYWCYNLSSLTLGRSVKTIGREAFFECFRLNGKLEIPESVTSIGVCAFHGCARDTDILAFFEDHPEFIEVEETASTAPTVTAAGSVTYKVSCVENTHTNGKQKFIKYVTKEIPYIYIDTITADPTEVTLAVGKTAQIGTTVTPLDAMDPTVAFSSDDTNVVTVDNTGLLTAGNPGTATVTIVPADGSDHATATVNVTVYDLTVPEKIVVAVDGTASAAAVVDPDIAVTPERTYTSSDENIFTVDSEGNITPVAAGTATVTVTDGEITKTIPVTVVNATVSVDKDTLAKDETADISVTALPDGTVAVQSVSYVSSDETILTVSDAGIVTALKTGDATITVTASILAAGETVTVTKTLNFSVYTPVTSITATAEKTLLDMEDAPYTQITVEALPEEADIRNVIYTSSDPSVLDVDADGLVIALHQGTATVTITAADGYGAETTIDFTVTHDLYALRVGPTVEEDQTGEATVETNTARRFTVRYTSSDPEILEVDPDTGAYTAKKKGTVTVTAELDFEDGGHKTLTQEIVVRDPHEGEFRCSRCDWYDDVKDAPGIRGIVYWMIHTITHFVELINSMT